MKRVFITASFQNGKNRTEIEKLCALVKQAGFNDFCFIRDVEHYQKIFDNPKELMLRARKEISNCDILLIDITGKPTGRAYEAGIAYALGKEIVVIAKKGTNIKDTSKGIATKVIEYNQIEDIVSQLRQA
jgi:nucleoside 2-deoxyribosyltransferase